MRSNEKHGLKLLEQLLFQRIAQAISI